MCDVVIIVFIFDVKVIVEGVCYFFVGFFFIFLLFVMGKFGFNVS